MEEFVCDIEFKYGVPMIILDLIHVFTGYDIVQAIRDEFEPTKHIERMNTEDDKFCALKNTIPDEYQDPIFAIFDSLGKLNLRQIQAETNLKNELQRKNSLSYNAEDSQATFKPKEMSIKDRETY